LIKRTLSKSQIGIYQGKKITIVKKYNVNLSVEIIISFVSNIVE